MLRIDPWIDFGDYSERLQSINASAETRAVHLAKAYRLGIEPRCTCVHPSIPVGVARRGGQAPLFYLYNLKRDDVDRHHPLCAFAKTMEGEHANASRRRGPEDSPEALLDAVIEKAKLSFWSAKFKGKRRYPHIRYKLIEAAKHVAFGDGVMLSSRLYVPPQWSEKEKEEIDLERQEFQELMAAESMGSRCVILGGCKSAVNIGNGKWEVTLHSHHDSFTVEAGGDPFNGFSTDGQKWLCLVILENAGHRGLIPCGIAARRTSMEWVPVWSREHAWIANDLTSEGVSFTSPLAGDKKSNWAVPNLIVYGAGGQKRTLGPKGEELIC